MRFDSSIDSSITEDVVGSWWRAAPVPVGANRAGWRTCLLGLAPAHLGSSAIEMRRPNTNTIGERPSLSLASALSGELGPGAGWLAMVVMLLATAVLLATLTNGAEAFVQLRQNLENVTLAGADPLTAVVRSPSHGPWFVGAPVLILFFPFMINSFMNNYLSRVPQSTGTVTTVSRPGARHLPAPPDADENQTPPSVGICGDHRRLAILAKRLAISCSVLSGLALLALIPVSGPVSENAQRVSLVVGMLFFLACTLAFFVMLGVLAFVMAVLIVVAIASNIYYKAREVITGEPQQRRQPNSSAMTYPRVFGTLGRIPVNRKFTFRSWTPGAADFELQGLPQECAICLEHLVGTPSADVALDNDVEDITVHLGDQDGELAQLPCSERHVFHKSCLEQWLETNARSPTCPLCKAEVPFTVVA